MSFWRYDGPCPGCRKPITRMWTTSMEVPEDWRRCPHCGDDTSAEAATIWWQVRQGQAVLREIATRRQQTEDQIAEVCRDAVRKRTAR